MFSKIYWYYRVVKELEADDAGMTFGEIMRGYRLGCGLTLADTAARAGLSMPTISAIELGRTQRPEPETLAKLDEVYGLKAGTVAKKLEEAPATTPPTARRSPLPAPDGAVDVLVRTYRDLGELKGTAPEILESTAAMVGDALRSHFDSACEGLDLDDLIDLYGQLGSGGDLEQVIRQAVRDRLVNTGFDDLLALYDWSGVRRPSGSAVVQLAGGERVELRDLRLRKGWTLEEAVRELSELRRGLGDPDVPAVTRGSLSSLESGRRGMSAQMKGLIEQAYGLEPDSLALEYRPRRRSMRSS